jgi:hypothetical protein
MLFWDLYWKKTDISKANRISNRSQQEGQFAVPRFSSVFTTFRPEHLFAFTRTKFTSAKEFTRL